MLKRDHRAHAVVGERRSASSAAQTFIIENATAKAAKLEAKESELAWSSTSVK